MATKTGIKVLTILAFFAAMAFVSLQNIRAQVVEPQANPTPPFTRPDYNYSTPFNSCASCHFSRGVGGDHNPEAVGVVFDDTTRVWSLTGGGWLASKHSQTNEGSSANTYCAKCHSPLQAAVDSRFVWDKSGPRFENTTPIPGNKFEAVTCNVCHPGHDVQAKLGGRRLGIYHAGTDPLKVENWTPIAEGNEDLLCLNCHSTRHNEDSPVFSTMYNVGVRCVDCHMAVYGKILGTDVDKRKHDWKVAKNLPFSCGMQGSVSACHPQFSNVEAAKNFIAFAKQQHSDKWDPKMQKYMRKQAGQGYQWFNIWRDFEAKAKNTE